MVNLSLKLFFKKKPAWERQQNMKTDENKTKKIIPKPIRDDDRLRDLFTTEHKQKYLNTFKRRHQKIVLKTVQVG